MHFDQIRRREFITLLGGAAVGSAWPLGARAQQSTMPVIGYLGAGSSGPSAGVVAIFRQGLAAAGYVEGHSVTIEYRFAEGKYDRLPELAAELARREVAVIVASPSIAALAAEAATTTIPIVFTTAEDPPEYKLVDDRLSRPGSNAIGARFLYTELGLMQLELLRELVPTATRIGLLVNPSNATAEYVIKGVTAIASAMVIESWRVQIDVVQASDRREIEAAFATFARNRVDALLFGADSFLYSRHLQLATLATRHAIPSVYNAREYAEVGGLMSYGPSLTQLFRQVGIYTGRILQGAKPAELPVVHSVKLDFIVNLLTARALDLEILPTLLARADKVIE